ncbi:MAG: replicative DNA helicase [Acidimicrobiia bacterium]
MTERTIEASRRSPRVPPHSREAELSVLGAILLASDSANDVMDRLVAEDFYVPAHQTIFEAMTTLYNMNEPIDAVTVSEELRRRDHLERIGGISYLASLIDLVPGVSNIDYYAGIVEEHGLRRSLIRAGGTVNELAFRTDADIAGVLDRAEQAVLAVAEKGESKRMFHVGGLMNHVVDLIEAADGTSPAGLATGFRDLDNLLGGLQPANMVVIAARPSMGKSTLALNIATNVAVRGETVAIFSLEMSKIEIAQRLISSIGKVDTKVMRIGASNDQEWKRINDAAAKMYNAPMYVDDSSAVNVTDIRAKSRRLQRTYGLSLIVVDYLQLMQGSNRENRQQEIAEISRSLKNLAADLEVPIIAVSQLNRLAEQREDKRPRLSDLRESGALEQDADIVMFIYRDEYYKNERTDADKKGVAEIHVAKHRGGKTETVKMTFQPSYTRFTDIGYDR